MFLGGGEIDPPSRRDSVPRCYSFLLYNLKKVFQKVQFM